MWIAGFPEACCPLWQFVHRLSIPSCENAALLQVLVVWHSLQSFPLGTCLPLFAEAARVPEPSWHVAH